MRAKLNLIGVMSASQQFKLLTMSPAKRKRFMQWAAREVRKYSRKRIRQQRDLSGKPFAPRKYKKRGKMLRKLSKHIRASGNAKYARVDFKNALVSQIARRQQDGIDEIMTANKMKRRDKTSNGDSNASRDQARKLRALNYRIKKDSGKGWKRPSLRWMTNNLKQAQAGLLIKTLSKHDSKQQWTIPLPARSFLGVTNDELKQLVNGYFSKS